MVLFTILLLVVEMVCLFEVVIISAQKMVDVSDLTLLPLNLEVCKVDTRAVANVRW